MKNFVRHEAFRHQQNGRLAEKTFFYYYSIGFKSIAYGKIKR